MGPTGESAKPMGSPKFPEKSPLSYTEQFWKLWHLCILVTDRTFGSAELSSRTSTVRFSPNDRTIVYVHDPLGSPKKNSWLRPQKHYVYCTLLLLLAGPEIATKHTGCPKKTKLALCAL